MKNIRRISAIIIAILLLVATAVPAMAADDGKIIISNPTKGQVYTAYQIFTAIPGAGDTVSYRLAPGITKDAVNTTANFRVDEQGNVTGPSTLSDRDIADLKTLSALASNRKSATATDSTANSVVIDGLAYGYYYVSTTTGSAVSIDTSMSSTGVTIEDKNPPTHINKTIEAVDDGNIGKSKEDAMAQIGKVIKYESRIPIRTGAYNYVFTDIMSAGLTMDADSVKVYLGTTKDAGVTVDVSTNDVASSSYGTLTTKAISTGATDPNIKIEFSDAWLKANWPVEDANHVKTEKIIVIRYEAKLNENAVIGVAGNPNKAKIEYGNENDKITHEDEAKVYTAQISVIKTTGDGTTPLAGAGFVLSRINSGKTEYYKYDATNNVVTWTEYQTPEAAKDAGCELVTTTSSNTLLFKGLSVGNYTITETTVPAGYNKAEPVTISILTDNYTAENLVQSRTVKNQAGSELPSTGGMGTTLLYVVGAALVLGAGIVLIARRKAGSKR